GLPPPVATSLVQHDGGEPGAEAGASLEGVDSRNRVDPGVLDDVVRQGAVADDPRRGPPERLPQAPEELRLRRSIPRTELLHQGLIVQSNTSLHRVLRFRPRGRASSVPGDPAALTERWRGLGGRWPRAPPTR